MRGFLIDTNVISELRKPRCNRNVERLVLVSEPLCFTSAICFAEIRFGIESATDASLQRRLETWLEQELRPWFSARLLPVTENVVLRWRHMRESLRRRRSTPSEPDTLIAATAADADLVVVSRDWRPFVAAGVPTLNPWKSTFVTADGRKHDQIDVSNPRPINILKSA